MAEVGAEPSAPSGAERPLLRSHNGPAYDQLGSTPAIRRGVRRVGSGSQQLDMFRTRPEAQACLQQIFAA